MIKFVHMADVHLGYRQYNSDERAIDFAQAFLRAMRFAVERKVDFVLIAGDLFHKKSEIDPLTLAQATKILEKAKKAGIPVIAVEGNHDATYFKEYFSWLDYLSKSGLLINLKPSFEEGEMVVEEWDEREGGAYVDLNGVRIYGMKYYGSLTGKILDEYARKVRRKGFTIFMAHVGVEGHLNVYGCVNSTKLHRMNVDYVALGHIHKGFVEGKIFNPGSLETCDLTELEFERGFFYVEYDGELRYKLIENKRREFVLVRVKLDSPDYEEIERSVPKKDSRPVVDLTITTMRSIRNMLDEERIKRILKERLNPIVIRLRWDIIDRHFTAKLNFENRESIERSVVEHLLKGYDYGNITDEILRLRSIFCSNFRMDMVDGLVEDILSKVGGGESERIEAKDSSEDERIRKFEKLEGVDSILSIVKEGDRKDKAGEEVKDMKRREAEKRSEGRCEERIEEKEEEEVWDWRRAYVKRVTPRKRQKL